MVVTGRLTHDYYMCLLTLAKQTNKNSYLLSYTAIATCIPLTVHIPHAHEGVYHEVIQVAVINDNHVCNVWNLV